jgi:hypothetical protein
MSYQQLLEQANRRVASNRNRQFGRKASDAQMLDRLTQAARAVLDYHALNNGVIVKPVLDELRAACRIAELRAK